MGQWRRHSKRPTHPQEGRHDRYFQIEQSHQRANQFHVDLVWDDTSLGVVTPKYFTIFDKAPTITDELDELSNTAKLKHVMMGSKIWNSFTSKFQIDT